MMRAALVAALILPLAACLGGEGGLRLAGKPEGAQRSAAFFRGDVIVTGPPGYCVDPKSVQRKADSGFAPMATPEPTAPKQKPARRFWSILTQE